MPNACASRAVSVPISPRPTISSVRSRSSPTVCWPGGQWRSRWSASSVGRRLANASSPNSANSASGPACTPLDVVTATLSQLAGREAQRAAELLAGAGVAGLHPGQRGRAADGSTSPSAELPGIPNSHLRAPQRLLPARVVERDAALADDVPVPA